jgi:hypothetical protein
MLVSYKPRGEAWRVPLGVKRLRKIYSTWVAWEIRVHYVPQYAGVKVE